MKKFGFVLGLLVAVSATSAFANDGGVAYIDVQGIDPAGLQDTGGIKIHGLDATKLFDLLPAASSVSAEVRKTQHTLALVSDGWNLFINCTKPSDGSDTKCGISAVKVTDKNFKYDNLGDAFKYDKSQVCTK